ncbi:MAG: sulfatase [Polaribacter sp.]|nr:sulfatase [Polaribacter sp.]
MKSVKINYFFIIISFIIFNERAFAQENSRSISNDRQNFIFYLADDQDLLDYGCYGNPKVSTSNVDKLAEEGMKFTNFHTAQAICAPSRSQIFTGMYPVKNGCMANHIGVKPNIKSIATLLKDAGYEVVLAGKSHVKPNKVFNWTHYFKNLEHRYLPLEKIDNYLKNVKKPFCLFITSDYPHGPFPKTNEYTKKDIYQLPYDNGRVGNHKPGYYKNIKDDNIQLGKILKMVDSYNLSNNSMFIYASDHGLSGKWGLAEQGLKVPFIVRWPGHIKPNSKSNTLLSFVDVLPTLLEASKTEIPKNIDGKSFLNILKGDKTEVHKYIFGVATKQNIRNAKVFPSRMVKNNRFKLIKNFNAKEVLASNLGENQIVNEFIKMGANSFPNKPYEELYDLKNDPYQKNNLINNKKYKNERLQLSNALVTWMTAQNDFLLMDTMPLLKPTLHPLDKNTKWTKVPNELEGKLTAKDYIKLHY